jgi:Zn-dependent protease
MEFLALIASLVIVITIHEFSHAWTANYLGDPTARLAGRITLNPLKHLDPLGTIMMFLIRIGWGKPVPVNTGNFRNPRKDEAITALAGPLSNLLLAVAVMIPIKYFDQFLLPEVAMFLNYLLDVSIILFAFNMLPFPPLDGSKFFQLAVPRRFRFVYDQFLEKGSVYFLLFLLIDQFVLVRVLGFSILFQFIGFIFTFVKSLIFLGS